MSDSSDTEMNADDLFSRSFSNSSSSSETNSDSSLDCKMEVSCADAKSYENPLHEKCLHTFFDKMSNVSFVFEAEDDTVKLPAHKEVLAVSSPVFKQMFCGDLKEEGDVKIVDASSSAFKEFLQFFYVSQVDLTMENISEVLKLIDKYDVPDCYPVCIDFLEDNLTIDDILWGFNLSLTYKLTALKVHCTSVIQKNLPEVLSMFDEDANGNVKLTPNPPDRFLTEKDIQCIGLHLCKMSKTIVSDLSKPKSVPQFFAYNFEEAQEKQQITENEIVRFQLTRAMMLTDIFCSKVYYKNFSGFSVARLKFKFQIEDRLGKVLFATKIKLTDGENHIQLMQPIEIDADKSYDIIMRTKILWEAHYTHTKTVTDREVLLTPNVRLSFPNDTFAIQSRSNRSLISRLHFKTV